MFTSNKFQQRNFTLEILECPIIAVNCFASCIEATYLDENVRRPPIGNNRTQFAVILTYVERYQSQGQRVTGTYNTNTYSSTLISFTLI